jgi:hypothetical protein
MSKSVRKVPEEKKIHRVVKSYPVKEIDQVLKRINNFEDLENIDLDEVLQDYYNTTTIHR